MAILRPARDPGRSVDTTPSLMRRFGNRVQDLITQFVSAQYRFDDALQLRDELPVIDVVQRTRAAR